MDNEQLIMDNFKKLSLSIIRYPLKRPINYQSINIYLTRFIREKIIHKSITPFSTEVVVSLKTCHDNFFY